MSDVPNFTADAQPTLQQLATFLADELYDVKRIRRYETAYKNAHAEGMTVAKAAAFAALDSIFELLGKFFFGIEEQIEGVAGPPLARIVAHLLGAEVSVAELRTRGTGTEGSRIGGLVADLAIKTLGSAEGELEPGDANAKRMLALLGQLVIGGWFEGTAFELITTLFPDMDAFESVAELPERLVEALGLSRLSRVALRPLAQILIANPLLWQLNKKHTPTLLSASTAIRQFQRGQWDWEDVVEELARQGYNEERTAALLNEQKKFLSVEEVALLAHRIGKDQFDPVRYLGNAGYDRRDAEDQLLAQSTKRLDAQEKELALAYVAAFVSGDITSQKFLSGIDAIKMPPEDSDHYKRLGTLRLELALTPLTDSDAQAAVRRGIQTFAWYRAYLARRGFDADGIATPELLLRSEIDKEATAEKLRAQQTADRAAEKLATEKDRADRIAAKAIAEAQPAYADVRRAFVRGLVPLDRLEAAINVAHPGIAAGDAAALVADAQLDAETYREQLATRAAALAADTDKALPLATLEESVLRGVTTLDQFDRELVNRHYSDEARRVLVALLRGRLDDQKAARDAKAAAEARAQLKGISVTEFERAVRLGLRTPAQLAALLEQLGTPDVEKGLILDLLKSDMAKDADARAKREELDKAAAAKAIDLPLRRRAVLQGTRTIEQYAADLVAAGVALDNRTIELELVRVELEAAAAARARAAELEAARAAKEQAAAEPSLTLAQTEHAVKLGILQPDDLRVFLAQRGYSDADIETLVATVVADIPTIRQAQGADAGTRRALAAKGLDVATLEHAVARGLRTLEDYRAELVARGLAEDAVALRVQLLSEKVAADFDGLRKKVTAAIAAIAGGPTIDELEAAATDGSVDPPTLAQYLANAGVARDVVLVYLRLVPLYADSAGEGRTK